MRAGVPLAKDRLPWPAALAAWLGQHDAADAVVSCSALRRRYHDLLVEDEPRIASLHLADDLELIRSLMEGRDHILSGALLESKPRAEKPPRERWSQ